MKTYLEKIEVTSQWAFERYEAIRHTLPTANFPKKSIWVDGLADLAKDFDVFLLDAFGVLNLGQTAIKSAPVAVHTLQSAGKRVMVLTNGARCIVPRAYRVFSSGTRHDSLGRHGQARFTARYLTHR